MVSTLILLASLLAPSPEVSPPQQDAHHNASAHAGRDPAAHIDLALWYERHGMAAERLKHLALAVLIDPKNAKARGLLGLVAYQGKWQTPEKVREAIHADEPLAAKLAEYNARRSQLEERFADDPNGAAAHVTLGLWCEKNGLKAEATAHFTTSVMLDPYNDAAWKHLGCVRRQGVWVSREQLALEEHEIKAKHKGLRHWEPLLRKWRAELTDPKLEPEAAAKLKNVSDPYAVAAIMRIFRTNKQHDQIRAVRLLGQIDTADSTRELAALAVFSPLGAVREVAIETLRNREPRDYAGLLVDMIHTPITFSMRPVLGPGAPGVLVVETAQLQLVLTYDAPPAFQLSDLVNNYVGYDGNGRPVIVTPQDLARLRFEEASQSSQIEARDVRNIEGRFSGMVFAATLKANDSKNRMRQDILAISIMNTRYQAVNERVRRVLHATMGTPFMKYDENAWHAWWNDRLGYTYEPAPRVTIEVVASAHEPPSALPALPPPHTSCFPAGTSVRTIDGERPIESLRVGDQVLSQDVSTGVLSFQPILVVHHNGPGSILRFKFDDGETLLASIYHRFWLAGRGWAMARDLKPGNIVRSLNGVTRIASVTPDAVAPLYNLDVDESRTFFVGHHGYLVHDNRLPDPKVKPFDAPPTQVAASLR